MYDNLCKKIFNASDENIMIPIMITLSPDELSAVKTAMLTHVIFDRDFENRNVLNKNRKIIRDILLALTNMGLVEEDLVIERIDGLISWLNYEDEVTVVPLSEPHINQLSEITMEQDTMMHIGNGKTWSVSDIRKIMQYEHNYVIIVNNQVIGYISLHPYNEDNDLQLRIFIGQRFTKQGWAKKALEIFKTIVNRDFYAVVRRDNIASNKLMHSTNFTFIEVKHVYGSRHNIYKFFLDRHVDTFYIPDISPSRNGLQFNELGDILNKKNLSYSKNSDNYIFTWRGRDKYIDAKQTLIKSNLSDKKSITDKLNLYANMLRFDNKIAERYMAYTCRLLDDGEHAFPVGILSGHRINLEDNYYIVKPVRGYSGDGITVVDSVDKIDNAYWLAKKMRGEIILSQYIQNVLLYKKKKFHIRVYLLAFMFNNIFSTFLWDTGKIMTSRDAYDPLRIDIDVTDTHLKSTEGDLFLTDLEHEIGVENFSTIMKHTRKIMVSVSDMMSKFIVNYYETKYGFEVYAADLIVRDDYIPVLLEINDKVGYDMNDVSLTHAFSKKYFDWIYTSVFSRIFSDRKLESPLFETDLTMTSPIEYNKLYCLYGNNYELAKIELPNLIDYPYLRYYKSPQNILRDFEKLRHCVYTIVDTPYNLHNIKLSVDKLKFNGAFHRIISTENELQTINSITDYFSEEVRVHCKFLSNTSIYEYYNKNISSIIDSLKRDKKDVSLEELREYLWKAKVRQCTTFKPKIIKYIIELFNAKTVLDISSGWGDRLIGTMSSSAKVYHGFDPNLNLYPKYNEIINFFSKVNPDIQCKIQPIPFEEAILDREYYDLVMSSPPYFTMEIYSNQKSQSTYDNPDEREWFNNYLLKWVENARLGLKNDGILALNINQERDKNYVNWLVDYMDGENSGFTYLGMIGYSNEDGKNPQPIFIWKKNTVVYYNKIENSGIYTRKMRNFHNQIKHTLIKKVMKKSGKLVDLAVGKGGDILKWRGLNFVLGIDIMRDNIENTADGAILRYNKLRSENSNVPVCMFLHGDSGKLLFNGDAFYNKRDFESFRLLQLKNSFDICSIQFAIHYMFKDIDTLRNLLTNVRDLTKIGGYFIGTSYDGKRVFNLLKDRDDVSIVIGDTKIWEITKKYDNTTFTDDEHSLGCAIDVYQDSINNTFTEYLVNYDYLTHIIKEYGFSLLDSHEYKTLNLPSSSGFFNEFSNNLSAHEKRISYLNRFFVYKRVS